MEQTCTPVEGLGEHDRLERLREEIERLVEKPPGKAVEAVGGFHVVRLSIEPVEQWLVIGENSDYIVLSKTYCSCPHFIVRVVGQEAPTPCYHLVAVEVAKRTNRFIDLSLYLGPREVLEIVFEAVYAKRSKTLRRILLRLRSG